MPRLFVLFVSLTVGVQGCATQQTTTEQCVTLPSAQKYACLDQITFGTVAKGAALGAATGAILGGAIAFAITQNPSGALKGVIAGAMVGGVAGGVIAYLQDKEARAGGNTSRVLNDVVADLHADNRRVGQLTQASTELVEEQQTQIVSLERDLKETQTKLASGDDRYVRMRQQLDDMHGTLQRVAQTVVNAKQAEQVYTQALAKLNGASDVAATNELNALRQKHAQLQANHTQLQARWNRVAPYYEQFVARTTSPE